MTALSPTFAAEEADDAREVAQMLERATNSLIRISLKWKAFPPTMAAAATSVASIFHPPARHSSEPRHPWVIDGTLVDDLGDIRPV